MDADGLLSNPARYANRSSMMDGDSAELRRQRFPLIFLGALFIATGGTALIAEQAFEKLLATLLGTSTPAAAAVLAIYFAGLTLGGWAYGLLRRSRFAPLRLYAFFELGVGLWAVLLYYGFEGLFTLFVPLLTQGAGNFALLQLLRLLVGSCWILPPTLLMGATFAAIVDAIGVRSTSRRTVAVFYALNLFGAVCGAAAGPYLVFPALGIDGALLLIGAVDITVALCAFGLSRQAAPLEVAAPSNEPAIDLAPPRGRLILLAAAALSGFLFFALEVLWTHLIAVVLGNSVYSFATMLLMVLIGLFIGGLLASVLFPGERVVSAVTLSNCLAVSALLLGFQQMAWPYVPHQFTVFGESIQTFGLGEALRALLAAALLIPPSIPLGMLFPLLFRLREFPLRDRGVTAGRMTGGNAFGCFVGALFCAFVMIPGIGSEAALMAIVLLYAITAGGIAFLAAKGRGRTIALLASGAAILLAGALPSWDRLRLTSGEHVYFRPSFVTPDSRLRFFHEDTAGGITTVIDRPGLPGRVLLTNGKFQGNDLGERSAQIGFALVPALHVQALDDALVIGLGTGQSGAAVDALGFRNIDLAEISPGIALAAAEEFGGINQKLLAKPNVTLHIEDGRNFLLLHPRQFDLITVEVTSIWFAGASNLYSSDFYELVARRLKPDGVFQQWVQLHHIDATDLITALVTVRHAFRFVSVWIVGEQGIVVASNERQMLRATGVKAVQRVLAENSFLARDSGMTLGSLLRSRYLSPADLDRLATSFHGSLNTDRNHRLEYRTPRHNLSRFDFATANRDLLYRMGSHEPHRAAAEAAALLKEAR